MRSLIELRKLELAAEIDRMISGVEQVVLAHSQYSVLLNELETVKSTLEGIKRGFDPKSDRPEVFQNAVRQLKELDGPIETIKSRGRAERERLDALDDAERKRLQILEEAEKLRRERNKASGDYGGTFALIGGILGGVALGCAGCLNVDRAIREGGPSPEMIDPLLFNSVTGLIVGALGGLILGGVTGAALGQMKGRSSSSLVLLLVPGVLLVFVAFVLISPPGPGHGTESGPSQLSDQGNRKAAQQIPFHLLSECDTPCEMDVGYNQRIDTGRKTVLAKFRGKREWIKLDGDPNNSIPQNRFSPGRAVFVSPKNTPSVRVRILSKR